MNGDVETSAAIQTKVLPKINITSDRALEALE